MGDAVAAIFSPPKKDENPFQTLLNNGVKASNPATGADAVKKVPVVGAAADPTNKQTANPYTTSSSVWRGLNGANISTEFNANVNQVKKETGTDVLQNSIGEANLFGGGREDLTLGSPSKAPELGDTSGAQNAAADQISRPKGGAATALGIKSRRRSMSTGLSGGGLLSSNSSTSSLLGS